jgi:hypothetical protein
VPGRTQAETDAGYATLGFVANPFPPIDESSTDPLWMRLVLRSATNSLLAAVLRSSSREHPRPFLVNMTEDVPEYYYRAAVNDFLARTAHDPSLGMMTLNVPLEMMRLGRIRGTLAEVAELVAAVDLPGTVGAYLVGTLTTPAAEGGEIEAEAPTGSADPVSGESSTARADALREAAEAFARDPEAAMERFFGSMAAPAQHAPSITEDDALHEAYLRQAVLDVDPAEEAEASDGEDGLDPAPLVIGAEEEPSAEPTAPSDIEVRELLLDHVRADLSPVIARALAAYAGWGDSIVAQELKVTKAPRKTLAAILRFMNYRWKHVVVLYDRLDAWTMMEQETRMEVLAAFTELRWIIGESGVMGLAVMQGEMLELEEHFAAGEHVDWSLPELPALYDGAFDFDAARVQRWLDAASLTGTSAIKADGPELAPLVDACENDVLRFALMAEAAFRDAAARGVAVLDAEAATAGLDSVRIADETS